MDDKKGIPQYRCQRCTCQVFDLNQAVIPFKTLETFAMNPLATDVNGTPRTVVHVCEDGGAGFGVIIGMMTEEHITILRERMAKQAAEEAAGNKSKASSAN